MKGRRSAAANIPTSQLDWVASSTQIGVAGQTSAPNSVSQIPFEASPCARIKARTPSMCWANIESGRSGSPKWGPSAS